MKGNFTMCKALVYNSTIINVIANSAILRISSFAIQKISAIIIIINNRIKLSEGSTF